MLLHLFSLKVYFTKSEEIYVKKSMFQNAIELAKSECSATLCYIFEEIDLTNNGDKGNPEGNAGKNENNQKNDHDDGKHDFYLTNPIKKFITTVIRKQNTSDRSFIKSSLFSLLGQKVFSEKNLRYLHMIGQKKLWLYFMKKI